ncbi:uncharacterized protein LOC121077718 isoform X2 [Cygnus olor]|uniref:uncharacterized protein LOC121077718 isoform X2 n=1 Tax=Cygnus olor TaxID=8869 RepID=UPI001ADE95CD|nr:uncharacterized protein LOC121077718 isoform X2 [Cygnus olor]
MPFLVQDKHLTGTSSRVLNLGRGLLSQTKAGSAQDLELCGLVLCVADGVPAELAGCRAFSGFADLAGQPAAPRSPAEPCVDVSRSKREHGQRGLWDPPALHLPCAASSRAAGRWKKPQRGIIVVLDRRAGIVSESCKVVPVVLQALSVQPKTLQPTLPVGSVWRLRYLTRKSRNCLESQALTAGKEALEKAFRSHEAPWLCVRPQPSSCPG